MEEPYWRAPQQETEGYLQVLTVTEPGTHPRKQGLARRKIGLRGLCYWKTSCCVLELERFVVSGRRGTATLRHVDIAGLISARAWKGRVAVSGK